MIALYVVNGRTSLVHHVSCFNIQRMNVDYVIPWPRYASETDQPCTYCLPNGLPQVAA